MKKAIEFLLSDTFYLVLLVLWGTYLMLQKEYALAYMAMAAFVIVAVRNAVKSKSE
jgi:hypothetical protein